MGGCRGRWWASRGVLLAALLAMATFILFRDLNIVGSRLAAPLAREAIAAFEYTALYSERASPLHLPVERSPIPRVLFVTFLAAIGALRIAEVTLAGASPINFRCVLARARLTPQALPTTASPADPF